MAYGIYFLIKKNYSNDLAESEEKTTSILKDYENKKDSFVITEEEVKKSTNFNDEDLGRLDIGAYKDVYH